MIHAQEIQHGKAAYYSDKFQGNTTASGEIYDKDSLTAAHRSIPFGTLVKVTNIKNHKSVVVRINDRGPYVKKRIIDLSRKAMKILEGIEDGVIEVVLEIIEVKPDE